MVVIIKMTKRCVMCKKHLGMLEFFCQGCKLTFCIHCRLPEDHLCNNIELVKKEALDKLIHKLYDGATKDKKIDLIN